MLRWGTHPATVLADLPGVAGGQELPESGGSGGENETGRFASKPGAETRVLVASGQNFNLANVDLGVGSTDN